VLQLPVDKKTWMWKIQTAALETKLPLAVPTLGLSMR